jgi:hypothetical protein
VIQQEIGEKIMYSQFDNAAMECARYIFDTQCEQESYQEYVRDGNDPRDHILYHAAVVLGETEDFAPDIDEYLSITND